MQSGQRVQTMFLVIVRMQTIGWLSVLIQRLALRSESEGLREELELLDDAVVPCA